MHISLRIFWVAFMKRVILVIGRGFEHLTSQRPSPISREGGLLRLRQQHADIAIKKAIGAAAVGVRMTPAEGMWKSNPRKSLLSAPATLAVSVWGGHGRVRNKFPN